MRLLFVCKSLQLSEKMKEIIEVIKPMLAECRLCQMQDMQSALSTEIWDIVVLHFEQTATCQVLQEVQLTRQRFASIPFIIVNWMEKDIDACWFYTNDFDYYIKYYGNLESLIRTLMQQIPLAVARRSQRQQLFTQAVSDSDLQEFIQMRGVWGRILDSSPLSITVTDNEFRIIAFNRGAELLTGFSREEVFGKNIMDLYPNRDEFERLAELLSKSPSVENFETIIKAKNGKTIPLSLSLGTIRDRTGNVSCTVGIGINISERVKIMEELRERNQELNDFAHTVAHGLKNPLISIHGYSQLIQVEHGSEFSEQVRDMFLRIIKNSEWMQLMIQDLLNYSKVSTQDMKFDHVDMNNLINDVIEHFREQIEEKNIIITVKQPIPDTNGHAAALYHIFHNLISNSIKFKAPARQLHITIHASSGELFNHFTVTDNGLGIASGQEEKIFKIFFRGMPSIEGTGVGLAVVERIIRKHDGRIWAEQAPPPGGAVFHFLLPSTSYQKAKT